MTPAARSSTLGDLIRELFGDELPVAFRGYDGSRLGPADAPATVVVRSPDALRRLLRAPGELGFGRAYVAGDLDIEGNVYAALSMHNGSTALHLGPRQWLTAARLVGPTGLRRLPPPPEEAHLHGRRHSKARDAVAIAHHYDVSNDFYRLILGPTMTYSCALWVDPSAGLDAAQVAKYELVSRKLDLNPDRRLLDVGCGWGGMLLHAALHHGSPGVGVTLSGPQAEWATRRAAEAGLGGQVEVRRQDYRDVPDGPYDAISSIGMFEHVGLSQLRLYFERLFTLLAPGGRLLNHGVSRPPAHRSRPSRAGFIDRYVFPDGELHEVGAVVSAMQEAGFEVRHVESLREHYALTLRAWVANLEANWAAAVAEVGLGRARVWRLYMAAFALNFELGKTQVHQVLAVKAEDGRSGLPLRPSFAHPDAVGHDDDPSTATRPSPAAGPKEGVTMKKQSSRDGVCRVTFTLPAETGAVQAHLCGEFNDWSRTATPMRCRKNGRLEVTLPLQAGRRYRFRYLLDDGRWENDWMADDYVANEFGGEDSVVEV